MERKIGVAAGVGLPLAIMLIWAFQEATGTAVPAEVATAFGAVLTSALAWVTPQPETQPQPKSK